MTTEHSRSNLVPLTRIGGLAPRRVLSFDEDEEDMTNETTSAGGAAVRDIPIDWEALEDAFENNAPEVHSYLHLVTGDVLRRRYPDCGVGHAIGALECLSRNDCAGI